MQLAKTTSWPVNETCKDKQTHNRAAQKATTAEAETQEHTLIIQ